MTGMATTITLQSEKIFIAELIAILGTALFQEHILPFYKEVSLYHRVLPLFCKSKYFLNHWLVLH